MLAEEYLTAYDDVPLYALRNIRKIVATGFAEQVESASNNDTAHTTTSTATSSSFNSNQTTAIHRILQAIDVPESADDLALCPELLCGAPEPNIADDADATTATATKKKKKKIRYPLPSMDMKQHRSAFEGAWLSFLGLQLPQPLVKEVLFSMSTKVLPKLEHPLALADFLTAALNYGGIIAVVAIHAIFVLVNEHGLDYPDFYEKLYVKLLSAYVSSAVES